MTFLGENLKTEGMELAANARAIALNIARSTAVQIARNTDGTCTADQVQKIMVEQGINLGPAAGSIFKGKEWKWTGRFIKSKRTNNHARILWIWELVK